ncbi:hypothetical protein [Streptomyces sp. NPDC055186]
MADEQYRWLNREIAERLLNGEPLEAADPATRDQAERLARTLGALSSPSSSPSADEELPGEAAALAAFRKVREERAAQPHADPSAVSDPAAADRAGTRSADAGPIRIGAPGADGSGARRGPHWARFARYGLAAALTVGMFGGAAVVAATGVLPTSSAGSSGSGPTASATATPEHPQPPPPTKGDPRDGAVPEAERGKRPGDGEAVTGQGDGPGGDEDTGEDDGTAVRQGDPVVGAGRGHIASACRALRDGRKLQGHRRHALEEAAGGSSRVGPYCEKVLAARGGETGSGGGTSSGDGSGSGSTEQNNGDPDTRGKGKHKDKGNNKDKGRGNGNGGNKGNGNNGNQGAGKGKDNADNDADNNGNAGNNGKGNGGNNGKAAGQPG